MALQVESQGQLQEFLAVLARRRWQIAIPFAFALALGALAATIVPRKYEVTTRIELREARVSEDPQLRNPEQTPTSREIYNAVYQIQHFERVRKIIEKDLRWPEFLALDWHTEQQEFIQRVLRNIDVELLHKEKEAGSSFVDITYHDVDRKRAAPFLNRLARAWVDEVVNRNQLVMKKELDLAQDRLDKIDKLRKEAAKRLAAFQAEHDLPLFEAPRTSFGTVQDKVEKRLETNQEKVSEAQTQLAAKAAEIASLQERWEAEPAMVAKEVVGEAVTADEQIAAVEKSIEGLRAEQKRYKPAHSRYQRIDEEVGTLEKKIAGLAKSEREALTVTEEEPNPERPKLQAEIEALEVDARGLEAQLAELQAQIKADDLLRQERAGLYRERDELKLDQDLQQAAYAAQVKEHAAKEAAYTAAIKAYGNPFEFAQEAIEPAEPSGPNPAIYLAFAGVAGLAIGLALALLSEYTKSGYRAVQDVARVMTVPILGVINAIVTRAEARRARTARMMTAVSTLVILGGLVWFTWAWAKRPEMLPTAVRGAIDDLRMELW